MIDAMNLLHVTEQFLESVRKECGESKEDFYTKLDQDLKTVGQSNENITDFLLQIKSN